MNSRAQDMRHISAVAKALNLPLVAVAGQSSTVCTGPTTYTDGVAFNKQYERARAARRLHRLDFCSGCGGDAVHRHSPSNHTVRDDEFGLCAKCHSLVHTDIWRRKR